MRPIDADKQKRTIAFTDAECLYDNNGKYLAEVIQLFQEKIDEQPTVEAEPVKHGHWVESEEGYFSCSNCHNDAMVELYENSQKLTLFCPHCGATMDKCSFIVGLHKEEFIEKYCSVCGSQRCEGIGTIWFNGCEHKGELNDTI